MNTKKMYRKKACAVCGAKFRPKSKAAKCCSDDCRRTAQRERARLGMQRYRTLCPERAAEVARRYRAKYKEDIDLRAGVRAYRTAVATGDKRAARSAVGKLLARFAKPSNCRRCGFVPEDSTGIHAHHKDYKKPLQVQWLCASCHRKEHRLLKEQSSA